MTIYYYVEKPIFPYIYIYAIKILAKNENVYTQTNL